METQSRERELIEWSWIVVKGIAYPLFRTREKNQPIHRNDDHDARSLYRCFVIPDRRGAYHPDLHPTVIHRIGRLH